MVGFISTGLDRWLEQNALSTAEVQRRTAATVARLLGTEVAPLSALSPSTGMAEFLGLLGRALDELDEPRHQLLALLAPPTADGATPGARFAAAVAEILFVPRAERTEYVANRLGSAPWDIRRLLIEYALWAHRFDEAATDLTAPFCATACERLPTGCCSVLGYDMGLVPEAMLAAQELEARAAGWRPPAREYKCKYHGARGCCLRRFKSPACAGMLCDALVSDLRARYPTEPLEAFLRPLAVFRNSPLDRSAIFHRMEEVVAAARRLGRLPPG